MNGSAIERGTEAAKNIVTNGNIPINEAESKRKALDLLHRSEIAMVGSQGDSGYPNIKAMFKIAASENLQNVWFSTMSSSKRVLQFKTNPKACVYFFDPEQFAGLMLVGDMEIVADMETKKRLWHEGWEAYYPLGITDPEYCLLQFSAYRGNYYHGLQNSNFEIE